jgi:ABC-2 type transport system permease protein
MSALMGLIRVVRAELGRLLRKRTVAVTAVASVLFALVATLTIFASATSSIRPTGRSDGTTIADLTARGGGTESFAVGASFVGFFVFVVFIALMATEFSGGTFRALLLRDPHRLRLMVGKLVAALLVAAGALALAELCSFGLSVALAPSKDIASSTWFSLGGLGQGLGDYGTALAGIAGWAVFGAALAIVFRSAPLALGVGFAWAGPIENIVSQSWEPGLRFFPGQVLGSLVRGGSADLTLGRAAATSVVYTAIAATVALVLLQRRDVTS